MRRSACGWGTNWSGALGTAWSSPRQADFTATNCATRLRSWASRTNAHCCGSWADRTAAAIWWARNCPSATCKPCSNGSWRGTDDVGPREPRRPDVRLTPDGIPYFHLPSSCPSMIGLRDTACSCSSPVWTQTPRRHSPWPAAWKAVCARTRITPMPGGLASWLQQRSRCSIHTENRPGNCTSTSAFPAAHDWETSSPGHSTLGPAGRRSLHRFIVRWTSESVPEPGRTLKSNLGVNRVSVRG